MVLNVFLDARPVRLHLCHAVGQKVRDEPVENQRSDAGVAVNTAVVEPFEELLRVPDIRIHLNLVDDFHLEAVVERRHRVEDGGEHTHGVLHGGDVWRDTAERPQQHHHPDRNGGCVGSWVSHGQEVHQAGDGQVQQEETVPVLDERRAGLDKRIVSSQKGECVEARLDEVAEDLAQEVRPNLQSRRELSVAQELVVSEKLQTGGLHQQREHQRTRSHLRGERTQSAAGAIKTHFTAQEGNNNAEHKHQPAGDRDGVNSALVYFHLSGEAGQENLGGLRVIFVTPGSILCRTLRRRHQCLQSSKLFLLGILLQ
mmetsp:Transcript_62381/g.109955  ORF Transcript_62381/g.109955 Transcript_62381/m.109955 type:complete len:313 (+) Transcript_62381:552-1490(+)